MSKISRIDAVALVANYKARIARLVPENKFRDVAINKLQDRLGRDSGTLDNDTLNQVRLVKHYLEELSGKLGPVVAHDLFNTAYCVLMQTADAAKAIKRARVEYDKHDRKMGPIMRAIAA